MMKKSLINYSLYQFITITTTYAVIPIETFAIEIEQTNIENISLSANEEQMKKLCKMLVYLQKL